MDSTPKTPWSQKRKCQAKMELMRKAKLAKSATSELSTVDAASPELTAPDESLATTPLSLEDTTTEQEDTESAEPLDESLNVPVTAQLPSDHDSNSSDDGSSFTSDDARQACQEWLKQQPKHNLKMMAVMFMDSLMDRFNVTTVGAAKEVGLLLDHNEKIIRSWRQDFYNNHGQFTESRQGKHTRLFILDDEEL